jgi:leucyl aminopeptidase
MPMKFPVKTHDAARLAVGALVIGVREGLVLSASAKAVDKTSKQHLNEAMAHGGFTGKAGQCLSLFRVPGLAARWTILIGLGDDKATDARALRKAATRATRALVEAGVTDAATLLADEGLWRDGSAGKGAELDPYWRARHLAEATHEALYRYDATKSKKEKPRKLASLTLLCEARGRAQAERGVAHGAAIAHGVALARELGNLPGNVCTPTYLAKQALHLGKTHRKLKVSVLEEKQLAKLGMGSFLSVSRGSREPAKLIVLEWRGGKPKQKPIALVGKGLTFDAGGISIKPAAAMDEMKYDMCGGAAVLGAFETIARLGLEQNVVGVVPASENLPDGAANKPGDIVTSMSGQTIEILNTDAEGRLILCDALTWVQKVHQPRLIVDCATLTGACVIALGNHAHGLFANDEPLAAALRAAGEAAADRAWPLPLWDDYQEALKSNFADMANVGGREGGAITAACFLARFVKGTPWAHLDIAGTAWKSGAEKGATGRPVPLLVQFLLDQKR